MANSLSAHLQPQSPKAWVKSTQVIPILLLFLVLVAPIRGQEAPVQQAQPTGFLSEFLDFDAIYAGKIIALAEAIDADKYDWRPAPGVRSIGEALLHVAQTNYGAASAAAGMVGATVPMEAPNWSEATEKQQIVALVRETFSLTQGLARGMATLDLNQAPGGAGTQSLRASLFGFAAHHSEHLGQLIAYARAVGTVPPWNA